MSVWSCGSVCIQEAAAGLVFPLASYSKAALLWQHGTDRAQHGLPLALDQADLGPDITSIAAASPLLALCCSVPLRMDGLFAAWSSVAAKGNANLTEAWLTTAAAVVSHLIFMFYCFHCPTSCRVLTALLTSLGGDIYGRVAHKLIKNSFSVNLHHIAQEESHLLVLCRWFFHNAWCFRALFCGLRLNPYHCRWLLMHLGLK